MKVFISHSRNDRPFVSKLAAGLKEAGHEPLVDTTSIKVGDNIIEKIDQGRIQSDYIVVVLSESANKSQRVQQEWSAFAMKEVSANKNNILPVLVENSEVPIFLQDRSYADFRGSFDEGLKQLLATIITFNFDDLVEENLKTNFIKYKSIFKEGQRCTPVELPIYHAHGFLPRSGNLTKDHEVVFSEDAYHSQFIDSFSWSNLIQLNHLNQNLCLFVGLSMTDPNLRRLLDVSMLSFVPMA